MPPAAKKLEVVCIGESMKRNKHNYRVVHVDSNSNIAQCALENGDRVIGRLFTQ